MKKQSSFVILLFVLFSFFLFQAAYQRPVKRQARYVFTFWEPRDKLPGYIQLCIRTWKKYLSDYEIIVLDYSNLARYLSKHIIQQIVSRHMTLPIQADAIRVAILQQYGGLWMDADTLITGTDFLKEFNGSDLIMFGSSNSNTQNIGFISASKESRILKNWFHAVTVHVKLFNEIYSLQKTYPSEMTKALWKQVQAWNYLGNGILDPLVAKAPHSDFIRVDRDKLHAFPELLAVSNASSLVSRYQTFYFTPGDYQDVLRQSHGIILLHNSWTPRQYKAMSADLFLQQDIMLSHLLSNVLNSH